MGGFSGEEDRIFEIAREVLVSFIAVQTGIVPEAHWDYFCVGGFARRALRVPATGEGVYFAQFETGSDRLGRCYLSRAGEESGAHTELDYTKPIDALSTEFRAWLLEQLDVFANPDRPT